MSLHSNPRTQNLNAAGMIAVFFMALKHKRTGDVSEISDEEIFGAWHVEVLKALIYYVVHAGRAKKPPETINEFVKQIDGPTKEIIMNLAQHWMNDGLEAHRQPVGDRRSLQPWVSPMLARGLLNSYHLKVNVQG